jgi:hypothetical protein|tara:strand:+ start:331 stop:555 length:225 start_codon:yes stop_codon:yes gene_type:complete
MISQKKVDLELKKRNDIIGQLRVDRNKMIISYQKINSDFIKVFGKLEELSDKINNQEFKEELDKIKTEFKSYFE